jgi:hypothetical protein
VNRSEENEALYGQIGQFAMSSSTMTPSEATRLVRGFDLAIATLLVENMEGELAPQDVREHLISVIAFARKQMEKIAGLKIDPSASLNPQLRPASEVADDLLDELDQELS